MTEAEFNVEIANLTSKLEASQRGRSEDAAAHQQQLDALQRKGDEYRLNAVDSAVKEAREQAAAIARAEIIAQCQKHNEAMATMQGKLGSAEAALNDSKAKAEARREALYAVRKHLTDADAACTKHLSE